MSGDRAGEQVLAAVEPPRWRRRLVAAVVVLVLLVVFAGSALTSQFFSAFPRGACKGVGVSTAITTDVGEGRPVRAATPEEALAAFAPDAPLLGPEPMPADGWEQYRGRWVRDLGDSFYEVDVVDTPNGWVVGGDVLICGR